MTGRVREAAWAVGGGVPDTVTGFLRALGGPAVLRVPGRDRTRVRAISTLLHGDEPSGIRAVHRWLKDGPVPATDVVVFVGAVAAALEPPGFALRHLPGRPDLNRCFVTPCAGEEGAIAAEALETLLAARPEALVDLHNTSGRTPGFAIGRSARSGLLCLASLFVRNFMDSRGRSIGSLVDAVGDRFPSVVVECGRMGSAEADQVAGQGLARYVTAPDLWAACLPDARIQVLGDPVRVLVAPGTRLAAAHRPEAGVDLTVLPDLDRWNFSDVQPGQLLGWLGSGRGWPLRAWNDSGRDVSRELFVPTPGGEVRVARPFSAVMFTTRPERAVGDCLGYACRRLSPATPGSPTPR